MRFAGKRVFITGGARGIGAATALRFAEEGAVVAINARTQASIDACRKAQARDHIGIPGEVGARDACHRIVQQAVDALGGLDVLVTSAGIFDEVPFEEVTQDGFDANMRVNLGGTFFCAQAAIPALKESRGNMVAVASDAGLISYAGAPAYGAAKGGVVSLVRSLAIGYAAHPVRVNCVCPGNVDTDMISQAAGNAPDAQAYAAAAAARAPMGRMASPEEVAAAILYLASDDAGFTTGVALPLDGGGAAGFD